MSTLILNMKQPTCLTIELDSNHITVISQSPKYIAEYKKFYKYKVDSLRFSTRSEALFRNKFKYSVSPKKYFAPEPGPAVRGSFRSP